MNDFKNAFDLLKDVSLNESNNYGWGEKCVRNQLRRILMYYPRIDLEKFKSWQPKLWHLKPGSS